MAKKLSEAARAAQREYHRQYRRKHKEQIEENRRRYWEKKGATMGAEKNYYQEAATNTYDGANAEKNDYQEAATNAYDGADLVEG